MPSASELLIGAGGDLLPMLSREAAAGLRERSRLSRAPEQVEIGDAPFSRGREAGTELGAGGGRRGREVGGVDVGVGVGLVSRESSSVS